MTMNYFIPYSYECAGKKGIIFASSSASLLFNSQHLIPLWQINARNNKKFQKKKDTQLTRNDLCRSNRHETTLQLIGIWIIQWKTLIFVCWSWPEVKMWIMSFAFQLVFQLEQRILLVWLYQTISVYLANVYI